LAGDAVFTDFLLTLVVRDALRHADDWIPGGADHIHDHDG